MDVGVGQEARRGRLSCQRFLDLALPEPVPHEATFCRFPTPLARHGRGEELLGLLAAPLEDQGLGVRQAVARVIGTLKRHYGLSRFPYVGWVRNYRHLLRPGLRAHPPAPTLSFLKGGRQAPGRLTGC